MIILAAFYKDFSADTESSAVNEAVQDFDYKKALVCLANTFKKHNRNDKFLAVTDQNTSLPFGVQEIFRADLANYGLIESLVRSNTQVIKSTIGKVILCGADHLINRDLNNFFVEDFDIGILFNGTAVNNTVVLANITKSNRHKIIEFFQERENEYYNLPQREKDWFGDQTSLAMVLKKYGFLTNDSVVPGMYQSSTLKFKFMKYGEGEVWGCKKSSASYNKQALFIDFKGNRKRWFDQIYKEMK